MEKSSDLIGNRTRDIQACGIVPQLTVSGTVCSGYQQQKQHKVSHADAPQKQVGVREKELLPDCLGPVC
jgi:hypothetical protein